MLNIESPSNIQLTAFPRHVLDLSALAAGEQTFDLLFNTAAKTIISGMGVDDCHIYKGASSTGELQLLAGTPGEAEEAARSFALQTLNQHSSRHDNLRRHSALGDAIGTRGLAVVIEGETAPFGVLVLTSDSPRTFSSLDVDFATCVASILTESLRRAHSIRDRARLKSVVDSSAEAVIGSTNDGRIFSWNKAAEHLLGYSSEEAVGRPLDVLFPDGGMPAIDGQTRGTSIGPFGATLRRRDGMRIEAEVRFTPIVLPDGTIAAGSMVARDMREKRRADRALAMHADILAHMPAAVAVWRLDDDDAAASLRLVLANGAADELLGCGVDDRAGTKFDDVAFRVAPRADPELYADVVRTLSPRDFGENWLDRADGSHAVYHVQAFPLPDHCVGVVFIDVTEQRELTDRLHHAQRLEIIGRLAASIAHDFNNLLTVISGYAEFLQPVVADDEGAVADLHEIQRASSSAQQLTRRLLAFGRRQVLQPASLDLSSLVRSAQGMLRRLIGEDIQLVTPEPGPVTVHADAGQIEQVLLNLAVNARDAMPAGGKLVIETGLQRLPSDRASVNADLPAGIWGVLRVADTGMGMDQRTLTRVFEPFFTTKEVGRGTGLGLSTVYGIVQQSGGHITVESAPGVGTTFTVYLPADGQLEHATGAQTQPPQAVAAARRAESLSVLIVEDDDAVRPLLQSVLVRAGYTVLCAATPTDALQIVGRFTGSIDLLVTDIVMPVQSGPELAARLMVSFPDLQVLYMSGYAPEVSGHRTMPKGAPFIHKPFRPQDLLEAVQGALDAGTRSNPGIPDQVLM